MAGAAAQLLPLSALAASPPQDSGQRRFPPINFIYGHFHNSIRAELGLLADRVRSLEVPAEGVEAMLSDLRKGYRFLEQVYKYHSALEDEVLYPALDSKVQNVTKAYSIEHQDEEVLLEQLCQLLAMAVEEPDSKRKGTIRALICKVEEVHTTLRKHLAKEEEQLLPLLLHHFTFAEQAELVAQFLYSIPLETVERVLAQLKPRIPREEQEQLLVEIRNVIPDNLLSQLLTTWLQPAADAQPAAAFHLTRSERPLSFTCCGNPAACMYGPRAYPVAAPARRTQAPGQLPGACSSACNLATAAAAAAEAVGVAAQAGEIATGATAAQVHAPPSVAAGLATSAETAAAAPAATTAAAGIACCGGSAAAGGTLPIPSRAPLQDIIHFHRSICSSLADFAREARALQLGRDITVGHLSSLLERHRFLRSVYVFHSISEEEVLLPEVQRLAASGQGGGAAQQCEADHQAELTGIEHLGRLLADVRAYARRGRKEVAAMLEKLCCTAEAVHASIEHHMRREEASVFPLLQSHLCETQQRALVYRTLRAMPLRLLERVMPWVVSRLDNAAATALLSNIRLGAPGSDQALVELLSRWARRGRRGISPARALGEPNSGAGGPGAAAAAAAAVGLAAGVAAAVPGSGGGLRGEGGGEAAEGAECGGVGSGGGATLQRQGSEGLLLPHPNQQQQHAITRCALSPGEQPLPAAAAAASRGYETTALADDGADSKRRRISEPQLLFAAPGAAPQTSFSSEHAMATAAAAAAAAAAAGAEEAVVAQFHMDFHMGESGEQELSTAPRALLRSQASGGSSDERGLHVTSAGYGYGYGRLVGCRDRVCSRDGASDNGSSGCAAGDGGSGYNPIDHIFQFHKALRQELKQMEADAITMEHAVLNRARQLQIFNQAGANNNNSSNAFNSSNVANSHSPQPASLSQRGEAAAAATAAAAADQAATSGEAAAAATAAPSHQPQPLQRTPTPGLQQQQQQAESCGTPPTSALSDVAGGGAHCSTRVAHLPIVQHLHGRFQFMRGIYRAHSKAEDEIVFPALEAKQALRNVSHAYTLDHRQEEHLFEDLEKAIDSLRTIDLAAIGSEAELSRQVMGVRRVCAAVRASLETHIRSEESELWPLFNEHFSREEQRYLVGVIIGRTGAQVLQALLPWVSETFSEEEKSAMMDSLREATRNTMFDQWLEAVQAGGAAAPGGAAAGGGGSGAFGGGEVISGGAEQRAGGQGGAAAAAAAAAARVGVSHQPLQQVAEYLAGGSGGAGAPASGPPSTPFAAAAAGPGLGQLPGPSAGAGAGAGAAVADSTSFRPGWEDIFRMNQQQLEAAIHRVSNDSSLEPERKAYLMQNIMVSKYIVAQQRRMTQAEAEQQGQQQGQLGATASGGCGPVGAAAGAEGACGGTCTPPPRTAPAPGAAAPCAVSRPLHQTFHNPAASVLGCKHYQRRCQLVAPCCGQIHTCRLCHDEACDHRMDRYAVSEMRCMLCGTRQPVAGACRGCGAAMARYVCDICHLFDDQPGKDIYHCPFCNVCRRGRGLGVDFFHCMNCNACMSLTLFSSHKCREKCIEGNCPVCHEALFDSSQPIKELPCGHFLHSTCFLTYTRYNYTCPLCCKSVGDMSVYFQMLDSLLASERLPPEYAGRMQQVLCNDCGKMGFAPFHFVYHSCPHCRSYNTRLM